jgi:hypothetical protein
MYDNKISLAVCHCDSLHSNQNGIKTILFYWYQYVKFTIIIIVLFTACDNFHEDRVKLKRESILSLLPGSPVFCNYYLQQVEVSVESSSFSDYNYEGCWKLRKSSGFILICAVACIKTLLSEKLLLFYDIKYILVKKLSILQRSQFALKYPNQTFKDRVLYRI